MNTAFYILIVVALSSCVNDQSKESEIETNREEKRLEKIAAF